MKNYELLFIIPSSMTNKEIAANFLEVKENISKLGGKVLETLLEQPFLVKTEVSKEEDSEELNNLPIIKRKLAYPIKKNRFGFYCLLNFSIEPEKINEVDGYLKRNTNIIRYLITQDEPVSREEIELLERLAQRKKAEQEKEKKEKQQKEAEEAKTEKKEEKAAAPEEPVREVEEVKEEKKAEAEVKETKKEEKTPEKKKEKKETKEEKAEAKEEKTTGKKRKKKIKLEELEDKLDEILEDTMV